MNTATLSEQDTKAASPEAVRPNLKKNSVFFGTTVSAAVGAIIAPAGYFAVAIIHRLFRDKSQRLNLAQLYTMEKGSLIEMAITGLFAAGVGGYVAGSTRNNVIDRVTPYIDRLEAERAKKQAEKAAGQEAQR